MNTAQASDILSHKLDKLATVIEVANFPGSLEGLFAFHILEKDTSFPLSWNVNNAQPTWLKEHTQELDHFPVISTLGYSIYHWRQTTIKMVREAFQSGVRRLEQRDLFPDDGYSFINIPITFLGVVLGSLVAFPDSEQSDTLGWLRGGLRLKQQMGFTDFYQRLIYAYASTFLDDAPAVINVQERDVRLEELAMLEWGYRHGVFRISGKYQDISQVRNEVLRTALIVPINYSEAGRSALVWSAVHSALIDQLQAAPQVTQPERLNLEAGLKQVKGEIATLSSDVQVEFATLEARLLGLLDEKDRFGINQTLRSEHVRVLEALNRFSMKHLGKAFNEYCYEKGTEG